MRTARVPFKKRQGVTISSVRLRETTGADEEIALAKANARAGNNAMMMAALLREEMVRASILEVDDKPVEHPFDFASLNTKTRRFILEAYDLLNGYEEEELKDFRAGVEIDEEGSPSSQNVARLDASSGRRG